MGTKVVLQQTVLLGSNQPGYLQKVATVYVDGAEYRVLAPGEAKGDAADWLEHFSVRQLVDFNSEVDVGGAFGVLALKVVREALQQKKRDAIRETGKHPDGLHCTAQVCLRGHVQHCDGMPFDSKSHCTKCGAACINECSQCTEPIRGTEMYRPASEYSLPAYCHGCGRPYPWMEERLRTARELLNHDDKLTLDDRNALWDDLQYVMSDPKADLVPAKKKLIDIKLGKATAAVKEVVLDLMAKTAAEVLKG